MKANSFLNQNAQTELAKVDASVSVLCDVHNTLVNTVLRKYASPMLMEKYMPRLSTDTLGSFCLSEASSGSDAFAMKTTATKSADGSYYTINGSKMWITNSGEAGIFLVS
jgi:short/branched chain acyl-CoA dehydrogenase